MTQRARSVGAMDIRDVLIICPVTNTPVPTQVKSDVEAFKTFTLKQGTLEGCRHCGGTHTWTTDHGVGDAFLADRT
jgi:hypothetical protein